VSGLSGAFAATGLLYPIFGNLQKITAEQLGLSPILIAAANSSGGVMGKMIDAQSIVAASTATNWYGHEGSILRLHSRGFFRRCSILRRSHPAACRRCAGHP